MYTRSITRYIISHCNRTDVGDKFCPFVVAMTRDEVNKCVSYVVQNRNAVGNIKAR